MPEAASRAREVVPDGVKADELKPHASGAHREIAEGHRQKGLAGTNLLALVVIGRGGGIRTRDPLHPMQVRYQAALHPDEAFHYTGARREHFRP